MVKRLLFIILIVFAYISSKAQTLSADFSISPAGSLCSDSSFTFNSGSTTYTGTGSLSYVWLFGDLTQDSGSITSKKYSSPGAYNVTLIVSSSNAEVDTVVKAVTVNVKPTPEIIGDSIVCASTTGYTYMVSSTSGSTYAWNISGGTITATNSNYVVVDWANGSNGILSVTETSSKGCKEKDSLKVTINPRPATKISGPQNTCTGKITSHNTPYHAGSSYYWTVTGGFMLSRPDSNGVDVQWPQNGFGSVEVNETNAFGCDTTVSENISILSGIPLSFSSTDDCNLNIAFTNTTTGTGISYLWKFGDGDTSTAKSPGHKYDSAGNYVVWLIAATTNGCKDSISKTITVNSKPVAFFGFTNGCTNSKLNIADNSSIKYGTIGSYLWNFGDSTISTAKFPSKFYTKPGTYKVWLVVTSSAGCKDSVSHNINISSSPSTIISGDSVVCANTTGHIYSTPNNSNATYSWSIQGGNITGGNNTNSVTVKWHNSGTGSLNLTETGNTGCKTTVSFKVNKMQEPAPIVKGTYAVCTNDTSYYFTNNTTGSTFNWAITGGNIVSGQNTNMVGVVWSNLGFNTVTVTETNVNGCEKSHFIYTKVSAGVIAGFNTSLACNSTSVLFNNTSSISSGNIVSYNWNFGDKTTSTSTSPVKTYTNPGTYKVVLTAISDSGCNNTFSDFITVHPQPKADFSFSDACVGEDISLQNLSSIDPNATATYLWNFGDNKTSNSANPVKAFSAAGTYEIWLFATSNNGCKDSINKNITIHPRANVDFAFTDACVGEDISLQNLSSIDPNATATYLWNFGDNTTSTSANPVKAFSAAGTYEIWLFATSNNGCKDSISKIATIHPRANVDFTFTDACIGEDISLQNLSSIDPNATVTYLWNFGDNTTSTFANPVKAFSAAGTYEIWLFATSNNGCKDSVSKMITIHPRADVDFTFTDACVGEDISLQNLSSIDPNATVNYSWNFGDNTTSTSANPVKAFSSAGTYEIWLFATSNNGCKDSINKNITIHPRANVDFVFTDACVGEDISLQNLSSIDPNATVTYLWNFGDNTTSTSANPVKAFSAAGTYEIWLFATSNNGCKDSVSKNITIHPRANVDFTFTDACVGEDISLQNLTTVDTGNVSYYWLFGDSTTAAIKNPMKAFSAPGTYEIVLIASNSNNCSDSISKTVTIFPQPQLSISHTTAERNVNFKVSDSSYAAYVWSFGDGDSSTDANPFHRYPAIGNYVVTLYVVSANGCESTFTDTVNIITNSIKKQPSLSFDVNVFPNPFKNETTLELTLKESSFVQVSLVDITGREMLVITKNQKHLSGTYRFNIVASDADLKAGLYVLKILVDDEVVNKRIMLVK